MSDRAETSLDERIEALRGALASAEGAQGREIEEALAWAHFEQGELGSAFELLWQASEEPAEQSLRQLYRAELQAYCGNEEAALSLLAGSPFTQASGAVVRARVAAARGDWYATARWATKAFPSVARERAVLLAARAMVETEQSAGALELFDAEPVHRRVPQLERQLIRARLAERPLNAIGAVIEQAKAERANRLLAEAWADLSRAHRERSGEEARQAAVRAVELWDDMATSLPPPLRVGFWSDARRGTIRKASRREKCQSGARPPGGLRSLLTSLRALASERDLTSLLAVITDHAVSLSGAERGFVLLAGADGALEPRTIRNAVDHLGPESAAFSRSIAETVLIDGDPVVTVDASHDSRVQDFLSVHQLMLKSVACLPIQTRGRSWGVLYLEHRSQSGRFSGTDLSSLRAFADQAAIAIETSQLLDRVEAQKRELEESNEALRAANEQLEQRVRGQADALERTRRDVDRLQASKSEGSRWGLVGTSDGMRRVYGVLDRLTSSNVPVVVTGESGTGKELVARAIHGSGARAGHPFVSLNCGAIPGGLLESELFGHVAGAFTGATHDRDGVFVQAEGGTLFLDEIADMPPRMQLDLLRVLQEQRVRPVGAAEDLPIRVRLVTASKRPLSELVAEGSLREDLYYRIAVVEVRLPPLRDRPGDIALLSEHFLRRVAAERGEPKRVLGRHALQRLKSYDFPGNVRELEHILVSATVFATGRPPSSRTSFRSGAVKASPNPNAAPKTMVISRRPRSATAFCHALNAHGWNRARAARALGNGLAGRSTGSLKQHRIELPKIGEERSLRS